MWSILIALSYVWLAVTGTAGAALLALITVQRLLRRGRVDSAAPAQPPQRSVDSRTTE